MDDLIVRQVDAEPTLKDVIVALTTLMGEVGADAPFSIEGLGENEIEDIRAFKNDSEEYEVAIVVTEID